MKRLFIFTCILLFLGCAQATGSDTTDMDVSVFLSNFEKAVNNMDTYRFIMLSENWKGKRYKKNLVEFRFKKPNLMRTDVLKGKKKGSTVLLNKEGKVRGKHPWGFKKTLKPTDKRLQNMRGSTFMNASLLDKTERLKKHILETGCEATLKDEKYEGKPSYHLHIEHKDNDSLITAEDIWFNKNDYL